MNKSHDRKPLGPADPAWWTGDEGDGDIPIHKKWWQAPTSTMLGNTIDDPPSPVMKAIMDGDAEDERQLGLDAQSTTEPVSGRRPKKRADCVDGLRPCPFVGCAHHLFWDAERAYGDIDVADMAHTCALDIADRGPVPLEVVGAVLGVTRERARQIEREAMTKLGTGVAETTPDVFELGDDTPEAWNRHDPWGDSDMAEGWE